MRSQQLSVFGTVIALEVEASHGDLKGKRHVKALVKGHVDSE